MGMVKGLYDNEIQEMEERIQDPESRSAYEGAYIEDLETGLDGLAYALDGLGKASQAASGRIAGRIARAQGRRGGGVEGMGAGKVAEGRAKALEGQFNAQKRCYKLLEEAIPAHAGAIAIGGEASMAAFSDMMGFGF